MKHEIASQKATPTRETRLGRVSGNFRKFPVLAKRTGEAPPTIDEASPTIDEASPTIDEVPPSAGDAPPSDLTDRQKIAVELLALGRTLTAAARALNVTPRTIFNWRQDELFQEALDRRRRELWSLAADRLRGMVHPALDVLERQLQARHDRGRYRAANAVLRHSNLRKIICVEEDQP